MLLWNCTPPPTKKKSYCFQRHTMFLIFRNVTCPFLLHFYIHLLYMVNVKEPVLLSNELGCSFTAGGSTKLPSQESDECILTQLHTACQISHPLISMYTYVKALKCKGHTCIMETRCSIQPLLINNRCSWPQFSEEGEMSLVLSFSKCKSPADSICLCGCSLNQKSSNRARAISHDSLSFSSQYPTSATSASDTHTHCVIECCYSPMSHSRLKEHPKGPWNFQNLNIIWEGFSLQLVCH